MREERRQQPHLTFGFTSFMITAVDLFEATFRRSALLIVVRPHSVNFAIRDGFNVEQNQRRTEMI